MINKENVETNKIHLIHHGFLISEFAEVTYERLHSFKNKYSIKDTDIIIGVISRYTLWKGIQYIIPAFKEYLKTYPSAKLLIANAHGNDEEYIKDLLYTIPRENIIEVKYERDMAALYHSLTFYVHTPINEHCEAFGQTYIEALIAKVPSIFTLSGIAKEFIINRQNAIAVDFKNEIQILEALLLLSGDKNLAATISEQGYNDVVKEFELSLMINKLYQLYKA